MFKEASNEVCQTKKQLIEEGCGHKKTDAKENYKYLKSSLQEKHKHAENDLQNVRRQEAKNNDLIKQDSDNLSEVKSAKVRFGAWFADKTMSAVQKKAYLKENSAETLKNRKQDFRSRQDTS